MQPYKNDTSKDAVLKNITTPVFDLLDDLFKKPVKTALEILPNVVYFIDSGNLEVCITNLLLPVTALLEKIEPIYKVELDTSTITSSMNVNDILATQDMIDKRHLDIRTITMGISLLDCCHSDIDVMEVLSERYAENLNARYKITSNTDEPGYEILERAGKARGFLISGGEVNTERMAKTLLDEFREGTLGRITLENVSEADREPLEKIEFRGMLSEW